MLASIVIPCYNERAALVSTVEEILNQLVQEGSEDVEVIVVNDGSSDGSDRVLEELAHAHSGQPLRVVHHRRNLGYGAALKSGIRRSHAEYICITDADGTYPNHRIPELLRLAREHDMVVGARIGEDATYSKLRSIPKMILIPWVSFLCGGNVPDMNSGLRVFRRDVALKFLKLLPDGFSFTTTITICLMRNRHDVLFVPISYTHRIGKSHIRPIRDTLRFVQLIGRTGMYFAPMRLLTPIVILLVILFVFSALYDVLVLGNLTDKTILLAMSSLNTFIFAMLADMIDKRSTA
ncbi:glycosyltransferase family 2 protein [Synechococcus sp. CCY 9618]|uniref:glycosyltransferase family 2 protein n=1 Tax=Synechococcus sp. CCY 9618 TaxID=2815602 RepID=UPI001C245A58|nr:glycosyltransferase family 2 protein [Synechococcus sp. CCY 9618]